MAHMWYNIGSASGSANGSGYGVENRDNIAKR